MYLTTAISFDENDGPPLLSCLPASSTTSEIMEEYRRNTLSVQSRYRVVAMVFSDASVNSEFLITLPSRSTDARYIVGVMTLVVESTFLSSGLESSPSALERSTKACWWVWSVPPFDGRLVAI